MHKPIIAGQDDQEQMDETRMSESNPHRSQEMQVESRIKRGFCELMPLLIQKCHWYYLSSLAGVSCMPARYVFSSLSFLHVYLLSVQQCGTAERGMLCFSQMGQKNPVNYVHLPKEYIQQTKQEVCPFWGKTLKSRNGFAFNKDYTLWTIFKRFLIHL